jgi:pyruvate formate lyase activating enzyme
MDVCIPGALSVMGKVWDIDALVSQVKRDAPFYRNSGGGVTLSGGEAFEQPDAAYELLQKLSHALIHTTVETSGYTAWTNIEACLPFLDLVLYDIKHMNPVQHKVLTGVDNGIILENLARLGETKSKVWIRMPVIPGLNDDETSILSVAKIANNVRGLEQIELLPYHPYGIGKYAGIGKTYTLSDRKPPDNIKMDSLREQLSKVVKVAVI